MKTINGKPWPYYIELAARIHISVLLSLYGLGKIMGQQFYRRGELPLDVANTTLAEAGSFDLAWTFMGYSFTYILFIGLSQLLGAGLLLFNKTKLLGVAILIPILANVIVFDAIFFDDGAYGALASACTYMFLLLLILYLNRNSVIRALKALTSSTSIGENPSSLFKRIKMIGVSLVIFACFFGLEQIVVNILGH